MSSIRKFTHLRKILSNKQQGYQLAKSESLIEKYFVRKISTTGHFCRNKPASDPESVQTFDHLYDAKSGAIETNPLRVQYGNLKITLMLVASILIGAAMMKRVTKLLEINQLFIYEDEDDDDDDDY